MDCQTNNNFIVKDGVKFYKPANDASPPPPGTVYHTFEPSLPPLDMENTKKEDHQSICDLL